MGSAGLRSPEEEEGGEGRPMDNAGREPIFLIVRLQRRELRRRRREIWRGNCRDCIILNY